MNPPPKTSDLRLPGLEAAACGAGERHPRRPTDPVVPVRVFVVRSVLARSECSDLVRLFELEGGAPSPMAAPDGGAGALDRTAKCRRDLTLSGSALSGALRDRLVERVLPPVAQAFGFRASGFEAFKLARYDEGAGWFGPHRDNTTTATAHRRVALSVNLDTGAYDGGAIDFPELPIDPVDPPRGAALVFDASLLHQVLPVTRGARHVLLTFLS